MSANSATTERRGLGPVRDSLRASIGDGAFSAAMSGLVESYIVPFAVALEATAAQIAELAAFPSLVSAVVQSQANTLTELTGGRKSTIQWLSALQWAVLAALACVPFFPAHQRYMALVGLAVMYLGLNGLISPVWGSLLSEYLPAPRRSGYLGWRQRWMGLILIGSGLLAGAILQAFGRSNLHGFVAVFGLAALCRVGSWLYMRRYYEPPIARRRRDRRVRFRGVAANPNFRQFIVFCGLMAAAVNLVGPLFSMYLLRDLHYSYWTYTLIVTGAQVTMYLMAARWGRQADRWGNLRVIRSVAMWMPLLPVLWVLYTGPFYLFLVQSTSGFLWAGYNLCVTNFIYDAVPDYQRIRATVLFNMFNSACIFVGAWLGGQLVSVLPPIHGRSFYSLALLSGALRAVLVVSLLPRIVEVRAVSHIPSFDLFYSVLGLKFILGMDRTAARLGPPHDS